MEQQISEEVKKERRLCPGCGMRTEWPNLCPPCQQHNLLMKLVVTMHEASRIIFDAYRISPHPAVAELKQRVYTVKLECAKAAGVE